MNQKIICEELDDIAHKAHKIIEDLKKQFVISEPQGAVDAKVTLVMALSTMLFKCFDEKEHEIVFQSTCAQIKKIMDMYKNEGK